MFVGFTAIFSFSSSSSSLSSSSSSRLHNLLKPTVWQEFTPLAVQHNAVNLGQGFPDWPTPKPFKDFLNDAVNADFNQYARSPGDLSLVNALSNHYSPLMNRDIDPLNEIAVTVGATEAIYSALQANIQPGRGDEVVILEPCFDIYPVQVQLAGGISKYVPLDYNTSRGQWEVDMESLTKVLSENTKIIILNTPHNPTGKVFTKEELLHIFEIIKSYPNIIIIMDEVYEKLVYDNKQHTYMSSLHNDIWNRTITVSSAGKTFSATGWKVGWCLGPKHLIEPIVSINQWIHFSVSTPTQVAVANILEFCEKPYFEDGNNYDDSVDDTHDEVCTYKNYYEYICKQYEEKRNHLAESLKVSNLTPLVPEGGFFIMTDISSVDSSNLLDVYKEEPLARAGSGQAPKDWAFSRWMTVERGVASIPSSAFYHTALPTNSYSRFAFCKSLGSLEEARRRLQRSAVLEGGKPAST